MKTMNKGRFKTFKLELTRSECITLFQLVGKCKDPVLSKRHLNNILKKLSEAYMGRKR